MERLYVIIYKHADKVYTHDEVFSSLNEARAVLNRLTIRKVKAVIRELGAEVM